MSDTPNDFIDQYQAWVREGLQGWSRQFDPKAASSTAGASQAAPGADIMGRLFAGLDGYGDWMRSMASGQPPVARFGAGIPLFGQGAPCAPPFDQAGAGFPPMGMPPFAYGPPA